MATASEDYNLTQMNSVLSKTMDQKSLQHQSDAQDSSHNAKNLASNNSLRQTISEEKPRITVLGLGPVGLVSLAGFSSLGFHVIGNDIDAAKLTTVESGVSPITEKDLEQMLSEGVSKGLISVEADLSKAIQETDVSIVAVGTPSKLDGSADLSALLQACKDLGRALQHNKGFHVIIIRSSVPPNTVMLKLMPEIERASHKRLGTGFGICFVPEFLREGDAINDFFNPGRTVIGATDQKSASIAKSIFSYVNADIEYVSIEVAEMTKYVDNAWHALKVGFANEIGRLTTAMGIDSYEVMDLFVKDRILNISNAYLKPGFAYGGSCLPKDLRSLIVLSKDYMQEVPILSAISQSNEEQIKRSVELVLAKKPLQAAMLGAAFKKGTDDLRESPNIILAARLIDKGLNIRIYDEAVGDDYNTIRLKLAESNYNWSISQDLLDKLAQSFVKSGDEAIKDSDTLIIAHASTESRNLALRFKGSSIIDLARVISSDETHCSYQSILGENSE